jgi:AcrR family transcriptional regulator
MKVTKYSDIQSNIIDTAERLFRRVGFQKTTVADIAGELQMSPANVYRFFKAKSEIHQAVCRRLLIDIESTAEEIAASPGPASRTLRNVILAVKHLNTKRFESDDKLHELFEAAHNENWPIVRKHLDRMDKLFARIIRQGMVAGEFRTRDTGIASIVIRSVCLKFCNSRSVSEDAQHTEPTIDQVVEFCLAALVDERHAKAPSETSPRCLAGSQAVLGRKCTELRADTL